MKHIYFNRFYLFISVFLSVISSQVIADNFFAEDSRGEDIWQFELGTQYVHQSNNLANLYGLAGAPAKLNADSSNFLTTISDLIAPDPDDVWGVGGRLGYVFESHKYDIQLRYFGVFSENNANNHSTMVDNGIIITNRDTHYNLNSAELMFGLYYRLTQRLNTRTSVGVAFASIDQNTHANLSSSVISPFATVFKEKSIFTGAGPKVRVDGWFDLWEELDIVGELGIAALLGNSEIEQTTMLDGTAASNNHYNNEVDQVAVSIDTTLGLKYAYEFENTRAVASIEAGYKFATYLNAFQDADFEFSINDSTQSLFYNSDPNYSFSGPYINLNLDLW